ncbi:hypothetical protein I6F07_21210 [Ensifer sp. IC4062]|nr:hypothetical protein [Ensifer sp. IC4062]MCA1442693.1 hypothetical protein [Ensifer sp. IC4062]
MFKDNTVFVIGAGASQEFGFPIGSGLTQTIKKNCNFVLDAGRLSEGEKPIFRHYEKIYGYDDRTKIDQFNERLQACWQIRDGIESADSIDEYIFRYSDNPLIAEVGKLQIAYAISIAEWESKLANDKGFSETNIENAHDTWIWSFSRALITGIRANEVEKIGDNITMICFNYDRCIEHYLEHFLVRSFHGMSIKEAREIVKNIRIIHPYGTLGDLGEFPFGTMPRFALMTENLITWSETIREPDIIEQLRTAIEDAERIVFMGFAFASQNMELLDTKPVEVNFNGPRVYATGFGLPKENEESLRRNINGLYSHGAPVDELQKIHFQYGAKCKEFFDIHRLNLVQ